VPHVNPATYPHPCCHCPTFVGARPTIFQTATPRPSPPLSSLRIVCLLREGMLRSDPRPSASEAPPDVASAPMSVAVDQGEVPASVLLRFREETHTRYSLGHESIFKYLKSILS